MSEIYVCDCGREVCSPGHRYGPAMRGYYLLHMITSGHGTFRRGGQTWTVRAGQAFMIFPDDVAVYEADRVSPWEYVWVGFAGDGAAGLAEASGLMPDEPVFSLGRFSAQITHIARSVYEDMALPEQGPRAALGSLMRLSAYLALARRPAGADGASDSYARAVWALRANYQRADYHIEDVASFVGLSRSQLFRIFRAACGHSPREELTLLRLRHACQLLGATDLTLTEVALSSGYASAARMGEAFRALMHTTPAEYRRAAVSRT